MGYLKEADSAPEDCLSFDLSECPCCQSFHTSLEFWKVKRPTASGTYWANCPNEDDPIFLTPTPEQVASAISAKDRATELANLDSEGDDSPESDGEDSE
jgi:hypothetical protein